MTKHYIKPYLGDEKIGSVATADIQQLYNWLRENGRVNEHYEKGNALSDSMIRSIHMMLHQAMDVAVREHLIAKNPTEGTVIPKNNYAPKQILTEEQLEKFLEVAKADPVWSDFFYTELTTGLRLGEICGLKWQDSEEKTGGSTSADPSIAARVAESGWAKPRRKQAPGLSSCRPAPWKF